MAMAKRARVPLTIVPTHDRPCLQPNPSTPPARLSPRSRPSLPTAARRLAAIQRDEEVEKNSERQGRVLKRITGRQITLLPCHVNYVRCGFEGRKQPAQLALFPIPPPPPPPPLLIVAPRRKREALPAGLGRPDGMTIRLSIEFSGEAACGIGPNYVAVRGECAAETGHCM